MIKVLLIGSVNSTYTALERLIFHNIRVVGVMGYETKKSTKLVSGYVDLRPLCLKHQIPYENFEQVNSEENVQYIKDAAPDVLMIIGLSQLVSAEILDIPALGSVGFHPTLLPRGRGRAPIAWLILEEEWGAANLFLMGAGTDDGPLFIQEPFKVNLEDDAALIEKKALRALGVALDKWLPDLKNNIWDPVAQNEAFASYYEKRNPNDGWIDWNNDAVIIERLIKATAFPYPGAYSFVNNKKITINNSTIEKSVPIKGVVGRVLKVDNIKGYLIQCGKGLIWINSITDEEDNSLHLKVGQKLGYYCELEIYKIKKQLSEIEKLIKN